MTFCSACCISLFLIPDDYGSGQAAAMVKDGYLLIDDTVWQRFGKKLEGVSVVWDSTLGKRVLGTNVVLLLWTDGKRRIPLGLRIWRKGGKSKVKLAEELLWEARRRGVTPLYVMFDAKVARRPPCCI